MVLVREHKPYGMSAYPQHPTHAEPPNLFETSQRLLDQIFNERVEGPFKEWLCYRTDVCVNANEIHKRFEYI